MPGAGAAGSSVRASHCHATLRTLRTLDPGALERVQARLPGEILRAITSATSVDLVPARWDLLLVEAIALELGLPATRGLARATMLDSLRGPLLHSFLTAAVGIFGRSPGKLFGWSGRVWGHVTSGAGVLRLEAAADDQALLLLEGMPADLAVPVYLEAVAGTLESLFDVCQVTGTVAVTPGPDGARFEASWRLPDGRGDW